MKNINFFGFLQCFSIVFLCPHIVMAQIGADYTNGGGIRIGSSTTTCDAAAEGGIRYNTITNELEFCDAASWRRIAGVLPTLDCDPDSLSFTDVTSQELGAQVLSNTVVLAGIDNGCVVSVSGTGTPEIRVNVGSWVGSATVDAGDSLEVRMTTSTSASSLKTATVSLGTITDDWDVTTKAGSLKIFVTSGTYTGTAIGGLTGADALCQASAGGAGYAGTYKAILSDETTDAKDRLTLTYPIVRASNGTTVAINNLWAGSLNAGIGTGALSVWTGSNAIGNKTAGLTCDSWTGTGVNATTGQDSNSTNEYWMKISTGGCSGAKRIYCVEQ